jgi:fibronectin type 3 domain-containing protein
MGPFRSAAAAAVVLAVPAGVLFASVALAGGLIGGLAGASMAMDPKAPKNLEVEDVTTTTVELDWRRVSGADGYIVYRDGNPVAAPSISRYTDEGLTPFTTYEYWVTAFDDDGDESDPSKSVQATTLDGTPPTPPTDLSATATSDPHVDLTWSASEDPESGVAEYRVFRDGSHVGTTATATYEDTDVDPGTTYEYTVTAINGQGLESDPSDPASAITPDVTGPTAPTDLAATAVGPKRIDLVWTASEDPETGVSFYRIFRGGFQIATATGTSYADADLMPETAYTYRVAAVNGVGLESLLSDPASATTLESTEGPPPPTQVRAAVISGTQVNLSWTAPDVPEGDIAGYNVYRDGQFIGSVTATAFADIDLTPATTYGYTVSSFDGEGLEGARSAVESATTLTVGGGVPPAAPTGLRIVSS